MRWMFSSVVVAVLVSSLGTGCGDVVERLVQPIIADSTSNREPGSLSAVYTGDWTSYILSEARYALDRSRNGTSSLTRSGLYMGDWNYVSGGSDNQALQRLAAKYTGGYGTGTYGFNVYGQGGWCKFFADLVLYRSSYGIGNGYHLTLPEGYAYATTNPRSAGIGWILQSSLPHTAIIDSPYYSGGSHIGWWVIDANWIGSTPTQYSWWIGKHAMTFTTLDVDGFKAWKPNVIRQF